MFLCYMIRCNMIRCMSGGAYRRVPTALCPSLSKGINRDLSTTASGIHMTVVMLAHFIHE